MAGDWIKMRGNLWDDPRVSQLCDLTEQTEASIIGGLYWLWATADQHSEDGRLPGLTCRQIDRKTGVAGLGAALVQIGWISEVDGAVLIARFDEHNGSSAKARAGGAKRAAKHRVTHPPLLERDETVTTPLPREEKRREEVPLSNVVAEEQEPQHAQSARAPEPGSVCKAMKQAGVSSCNPSHPQLRALLAQGAELAEFVAAATEAAAKGKGFAYALAVVKGRRDDAARAPPAGTPLRAADARKAQRTAILDQLTGRTRTSHEHDLERTVDVAATVVTH